MKKLAILFTSLGGLVNDMKSHIDALSADVEIMRIADESLIADVKRYGGQTPAIALRAVRHMETAYMAGADMIICACSSIGEAAETADKLLPIPVMRIDEAMLRKALTIGKRVGVLASLGTTLYPTCDYLRRLALENGTDVEIVSRVAQGAYEAQAAKNRDLHDELLEKAALDIAGQVDVIVLAQGSMARVETRLANVTGLTVLSSPALCAEAAIKALACIPARGTAYKLAALAVEKAAVCPGDNIYIEGAGIVADAIRASLPANVRLLPSETPDASAPESHRPNVAFITEGAEGSLENAVRAITPAGRIIITGAKAADARYNVLAASHREVLIEGVSIE